MFILGFLFYFTAKKTTVKNVATVLMGFALLFMGLKMISISSHYFSKLEILSDLFQSLRDNLFYSFLISTIFCVLVQSSAVTIGLAMSLATANVISVHDAMIWVYNANISTTSTTLIAAAGSNYVGKQVAWAHFFYKTVSVLIFYPLTSYFLAVVESFQTTPSRMIANSHFFFNVASALIFFPFIKKGTILIEKLFPKTAGDEFGTEFLAMDTYQNSALAISYSNGKL